MFVTANFVWKLAEYLGASNMEMHKSFCYISSSLLGSTALLLGLGLSATFNILKYI
jgi:hypothetical protein